MGRLRLDTIGLSIDLEKSISDSEIEDKVKRIARWTRYLSEEVKSDHILQSLAHEALNSLVGPNALHSNEEFRSQDKKDWATDLLNGVLDS